MIQKSFFFFRFSGKLFFQLITINQSTPAGTHRERTGPKAHKLYFGFKCKHHLHLDVYSNYSSVCDSDTTSHWVRVQMLHSVDQCWLCETVLVLWWFIVPTVSCMPHCLHSSGSSLHLVYTPCTGNIIQIMVCPVPLRQLLASWLGVSHTISKVKGQHQTPRLRLRLSSARAAVIVLLDRNFHLAAGHTNSCMKHMWGEQSAALGSHFSACYHEYSHPEPAKKNDRHWVTGFFF